MTTIYLAWSGEYDDARVEAAFTRQEDAEALEISDRVEEVQLHDGPLEVRGWHQAIWYKGRPLETAKDAGPGRVPNPYWSTHTDRRIYDGHPDRVDTISHGTGSLGITPVWVEGWDPERIKTRLAELIAEEGK
jgi:hypothetical protein